MQANQLTVPSQFLCLSTQAILPFGRGGATTSGSRFALITSTPHERLLPTVFSRPAPSRMPASFARDTPPGRIVFRCGAFDDIGDELENLGAQRAMLIAAAPDEHFVENARRALGTRVNLVWTEIRTYAPSELAESAIAAATDGQVDVVVTIGGDSTTALGRAVAVNTGLPLVCVPTTYSGIEMTPIYGRKSDYGSSAASDLRALPKVVIYDPQLLVSLPSDVVGASGMNALANCAEALWGPRTDPITETLALEGVRRLNRHLRNAYREPDTASRGQVLIASGLAGIAVATAGTSIHHAICGLLGDMFDTPPAVTHAIVLPYAVKFVRPAVPQAIERLAAAMGSASDELPTKIWSLGRSVGTPQGLRAVGITESQAEQAAEAVLAKGVTSPRPLNCSLVRRILDGAWRGLSPVGP